MGDGFEQHVVQQAGQRQRHVVALAGGQRQIDILQPEDQAEPGRGETLLDDCLLYTSQRGVLQRIHVLPEQRRQSRAQGLRQHHHAPYLALGQPQGEAGGALLGAYREMCIRDRACLR